MSYHIVSIDAPQVSLTCRDGQLVCRSDEGERRVPLEDVASIIITSFSAQIHSHLFIEAARHGVALILCERFKPISLVLPACRAADTVLSRKHLELPARDRLRLWQRTIDAKCHNQAVVAAQLAPDSTATVRLAESAQARTVKKEGACAQLYWRALAEALRIEGFARGRKLGGLNNLLNYGYAVLLSTVLQKLYGVGLDPTAGISHALRERAAPLAYDLMEPFRPCVDARIYRWVAERPHAEAFAVTGEFRRWVTGFSMETVEYFNLQLDIRSCIESVVRSFRKAVLMDSPRAYKPWMLKNSKWAG